MNDELARRLAALETKTDAIFASVEKTRKYFQILMWISIAVVALPAIGLVFAIPVFLNSLASLGAF